MCSKGDFAFSTEWQLSKHNWMPVILEAKDYDLWLDLEVQQAESLQPLLHPYSPEEVTGYPVSIRVNRPANNDSDCVQSVARD